jgi:hypothetical protein
MHLNLTVRPILVGDRSQRQNSRFLVVKVVALKHNLKKVLHLTEGDVAIVFRELLESEST